MSMREKYESLPLVQLRAVAKARGLRRISTLRKPELVQVMLEADERDRENEENIAAQTAPVEETPAEVPQGESVQETKKAAAAQETAPTDEKASVNGQEEAPAHTQQRQPHTPRPYHAQKHEPQTRERSAQEPYAQRGRRSAQQENTYTPRPYHVRQQDTSESYRASQQDVSGGYRVQQQEETAPHEGTVHENESAVHENIAPQEAERPEYAEHRPTHVSPRADLDSGNTAEGILEVMADGFGFIRCQNYLPGENDVYVAPSQIRRFQLRTGDIICGNKRIKTAMEKFSALLYIKTVNGRSPVDSVRRPKFENATPIFPDEALHFSHGTRNMAMRIVDLISPVGKGQRGMIVSPPKAGKTTLLKEIARSVTRNYPDMHLIILLIDERPEEVTDIKESIQGENVEVIYSTFDELPERHKRVSEMVLERAKRLAEEKKDVIILLDSITRLARAYNLTVPPSGRTLSGGLDPAALHMPKRFFGAARNLREGGSLTILATALVETGSKMDDVVYEEFKGTGNMEMVLDRKLSERRVFPAVDIVKSGTRREDLLLTKEEQEAVYIMRRSLNGAKPEDAAERILDLFVKTRDNQELVYRLHRQKFI